MACMVGKSVNKTLVTNGFSGSLAVKNVCGGKI
jgi:hypothetical protein